MPSTYFMKRRGKKERITYAAALRMCIFFYLFDSSEVISSHVMPFSAMSTII